MQEVPWDGDFPSLYAEEGPEYRTVHVHPVLREAKRSDFHDNDILRLFHSGDAGVLDEADFREFIEEYGRLDNELQQLIKDDKLLRTSEHIERLVASPAA